MIYTDYSNLFKYKKRFFYSYITNANSIYNSNSTLNQLIIEKKINSDRIASCEQIHSDKVMFIKNPGLYKKSDGLVAKCSDNLILKIQTADCVPISMYDHKAQLIGLIHSGWRGSKNAICAKGINLFLENGSNAKNIQILLGPSIKKCCYKIKNDVSQQFDDKYIIKNKNQQFLDIESKIIDDLLLCGVKNSNIYNSDICTYESKKCYSYRKTKNKERMYSILGN